MAGPGLETVGAAERKAVMAVFEDGNFSRYRFDDEAEHGPDSYTWRFERDLETLSGARHCLGMNSCTSALLAGLWAAGIGDGDEVIVPGYTFVASIAAIAYAGARPVLAEIDESLLLDPDDVKRRITPRTKAIMCVHMLGAPCDLDRLGAIAEEAGLDLIEDCAQAGGGRFRGRFLGTIGRLGAMSLNVFKTLTAGDGGVLLTSDDGLFDRAFAIHDHGASPYRKGVAEADALLGLNLRMHEMTGAMAWAQLAKLERNLQHLRQLKATLIDVIGDIPSGRIAPSNDVQGDCATVLPIVFDTRERAKQVASRFGISRLVNSGKHYYGNVPQLRDMALPHGTTGNGVVPGDLPQTDDILARSVIFSIGVKDSYLGASRGLTVNASPEDAKRFGQQIRDGLAAGAGR